VYPVFQGAGCHACHNSTGVASATRLHFPEPEASTARIDAFGKSLVKLADRDHPDESLLLKMPTLRVPHTGGERIKPGSQEEDVLRACIKQLASLPADDLKKMELTMGTKGCVAGIANSNFASPRELGALLARTLQCQECIVKQYFRYTAGRMETPADHALIARVLDDFRNSHFHFKEFMISLMRNREAPIQQGNIHVSSNYKTQ